jgi:tetratricopeptide (TPR) repeat protein
MHIFSPVRTLLFAALLLASLAGTAEAQSRCKAPAPVCAVAERVFAIASFDPTASAVLIEPGLLVTNRHAVANNQRAQVFLPNGGQVLADVVPSGYGGDLILLRAPDLKAPENWPTAEAGTGDDLYTIGADIGRGAVRIYPPGRMLLPPASGKPLARIQHDAFSQPGNSGGALVDAEGRLVAIVASGGEGRNEAIPAAEIKKLKSLSGPAHLAVSLATGEAYRKCAEALDAARSARRLPSKNARFIKDQCIRTNNRQLWDLAGQTFGRQRMFDESVAMFSLALDQDPNALNSMTAMAITLHLAGRYADEVVHLKRLVDILPADAEVLRLGVQAGAWGGDKGLAEKSLKLLEKHHPRLAPLARDFIDNNPTPPGRRPKRKRDTQ